MAERKLWKVGYIDNNGQNKDAISVSIKDDGTPKFMVGDKEGGGGGGGMPEGGKAGQVVFHNKKLVGAPFENEQSISTIYINLKKFRDAGWDCLFENPEEQVYLIGDPSSYPYLYLSQYQNGNHEYFTISTQDGDGNNGVIYINANNTPMTESYIDFVGRDTGVSIKYGDFIDPLTGNSFDIQSNNGIYTGDIIGLSFWIDNLSSWIFEDNVLVKKLTEYFSVNEPFKEIEEDNWVGFKSPATSTNIFGDALVYKNFYKVKMPENVDELYDFFYLYGIDYSDGVILTGDNGAWSSFFMRVGVLPPEMGGTCLMLTFDDSATMYSYLYEEECNVPENGWYRVTYLNEDTSQAYFEKVNDEDVVFELPTVDRMNLDASDSSITIGDFLKCFIEEAGKKISAGAPTVIQAKYTQDGYLYPVNTKICICQSYYDYSILWKPDNDTTLYITSEDEWYEAGIYLGTWPIKEATYKGE